MTEIPDQSTPADDLDTPWKDAVEHHFPEFLAFYFPAVHAGIDWMMTLPVELEAKLWQALTTLERNKTMPYVTSVERLGYTRGHSEGREEGRRAEAETLVRKLLQRRLGPLPGQIDARVTALSLERMEALLDFASVDDLDAWLRQH
jgi:hypothetical protein